MDFALISLTNPHYLKKEHHDFEIEEDSGNIARAHTHTHTHQHTHTHTHTHTQHTQRVTQRLESVPCYTYTHTHTRTHAHKG